MKAKQKIKENGFDTVKVFREIKEKVSKDLIGKSASQIIDYLRRNSTKFSKQ